MSSEIFSFHLAELPLLRVPGFLKRPIRNAPGLLHAESFFAMNLGEPILSAHRYDIRRIAMLAWWKDEAALDEFLAEPAQDFLSQGWHVRMKLYRRWGSVAEIENATVDPSLAKPDETVVAVTLARLKLAEVRRFVFWGKPVEAQVRDHSGKTLALAALRPLNTFSTFSIWRNEQEMIDMVSGKSRDRDGESHVLAMKERSRRDFHHEFTTMRFVPTKEVGTWNGKSQYTGVEFNPE